MKEQLLFVVHSETKERRHRNNEVMKREFRRVHYRKRSEMLADVYLCRPEDASIECGLSKCGLRETPWKRKSDGAESGGTYGNDHDQRRHADLLQGVGQGAAGGFQPWMAAGRRRVRRPDAVSGRARIPRHPA